MTKLVIRALAVVALCTGTALAQTGNGAPNGAHYNLNILGKENCSPADLTDSNRHTIQVKLSYTATPKTGAIWLTADKTNVIKLQSGDDFQVLDGNACDPQGALFQLPPNYTCPDADGDGQPDAFCDDAQLSDAQYLVYARAVSKPGGSAVMTTCTTGAGADGILGNADDEVICSTENTVDALVRKSGKPVFQNVTKQLTTVLYDFDADGDLDRMPIFADENRAYFWDYDNQGLRTAQLRFYPIPQ
jgi:hypothetical protein